MSTFIKTRRALSQRQWDDLHITDTGLLAEIAKRVDLEALRDATESNTALAMPFDTEAEEIEVAMHAARKGAIIDWERHTDEVQMVFVVRGTMRVSVRGGPGARVEDTTLAFIWPGDEHKLEALEDVRYASVYWTVDKPETWCRET